MKKLFSILTLVIVTSTIILSSCTEEQVKVNNEDNSGKTRSTGGY